MTFINLPEITCWGNPYSQRVCPSLIFQRLIQCDVPVKSRFLGRPRLLTRFSPPSPRRGILQSTSTPDHLYVQPVGHLQCRSLVALSGVPTHGSI
jgi:hypothetical protein